MFNIKYIFEKSSLISIDPKFTVKNKDSLSWVYTPGVGDMCLKIKNDPSMADVLTNKKNSVLFISDGSNLKFYNENLRSDCIFPLLEFYCWQSLNASNLNAYPLVLDHKKIKHGKEIAEYLKHFEESFSCVELVEISDQKRKEFIDSIDKKYKYNILILTGEERKIIEENINCPKISSELLSYLIKFFIYFKKYGLIDKSIFEGIGKAIKNSHHQINCIIDSTKAALNYLKDKLNIKQKNLDEFLQTVKYNFIFKRDEEKFVFEHYFSKNSLNENSLFIHKEFNGMIHTTNQVYYNQYSLNILSKNNLLEFCEFLNKNPDLIKNYTIKRNYCSIITDGTAILGLGNIGSKAGLPVMEGKSVLFKSLGGVNVIPICFKQTDPNNLIDLIDKISISFTAINLEDIKAPECFKIEKTLKETLNIPVFHDDQHGTAIVVLAGIINACKLANKLDKKETVKLIINGAGAAGLTICKLLITYGFKNIIVCDTKGTIYKGRQVNMNDFKNQIAEITNSYLVTGSLKEVIVGSEIFIGVSSKDVINSDDVKKMGDKPIIFGLANPFPEILPEEAKKGGAFIVATGRSDFPNQVNNSLVFPGLFRSIIDLHIPNIDEKIKIAAAIGISKLIDEDKLNVNNIITNSLNPDASLKIKDAIKDLYK